MWEENWREEKEKKVKISSKIYERVWPREFLSPLSTPFRRVVYKPIVEAYYSFASIFLGLLFSKASA